MLKGVGVSGEYVSGTVVRLDEEQLKNKSKYLNTSMRDIIIVVQNMTVKDLLDLERYHVVGIVAEGGNVNSHLAIQIRKMELTGILGVPGCMDFIQSGETVLIDGLEGNVIISPRENTLDKYRDMSKQNELNRKSINAVLDEEAVTLDGRQIRLQGNVEELSDMDRLVELKGDGVGLFRSESLFVGRSSLPTEDEQYAIYTEAVLKMNGRPVTIRTLDASSNSLPYLEHVKEDNPFLGCRGIRFTLQRAGILRTQCRAIMRASAHGPLRILLPMITTMSELVRVKNMMNLIREELDAAGIPYDKNIPVGIMIETPAAAWMADVFARESDFISIGSNDLTQYMLAADRSNQLVMGLYSHYDPAVLRAIRYIINCCKAENKPVYISGEAGSDENLLPLFLVYGIRDLSVNVSTLLKVRKRIRELDISRYKDMAETVNNAISVEEVKNCIDAFCQMYQNM